MQYIDNFIVDIKNICPDQCKYYLGGDSELYLRNFEIVFSVYKDAIVRIPVIEPYTYNKENLNRILSELEKYSDIRIQIFKVHNLGLSKYKNIGLDYTPFDDISNEKWIYYIIHLKIYQVMLRLLAFNNSVKCNKYKKCIPRTPTDGFAEQNGRDAERADFLTLIYNI